MKETKTYLPYLSAIILAGLLVFSISYIRNITFSVQLSDYYPGKSLALNIYEDYKKKYETNENVIVLILTSAGKLFDSQFLNNAYSLDSVISEMKFVKNTKSIFTSKIPYNTPFGLQFISIMDRKSIQRYYKDSLRILKNRFITSPFVSDNFKYLCTYIKIDDRSSLIEKSKLFDSIHEQAVSFGFKNHGLIGKKVLETQFSTSMKAELGIFGIVLFIILILMLTILFRSTRIVLAIMMIIMLSLIIFYGTLGFLGVRLEILSNILPILILVTCLTNSVHILLKYKKTIPVGKNAFDVYGITLRRKVSAVFLSNFTTALGFCILYLSSLNAIRMFGLYAAYGIILTFAVNMLCFNILLTNEKFSNAINDIKVQYSGFSNSIIKIHSKVTENRNIYYLSLLLIVVAILGVVKIDTNNKLIKNVPNTRSLKDFMLLYEDHFAGYRKLEILIQPVSKKLIKDPEFISFLDSLTMLIEEEKSVSSVKSISTLDQYLTGKSNKYLHATAVRSGLVDHNSESTRIVALIMDIGRLDVTEIKQRIKTWLKGQPYAGRLRIHFTGTDHLIDLAHHFRIINMFIGLFLSTILVSVLIGFVFKNIKLFIVTLVANLFPLLLCAGLMGWVNIELRGATSILFTVGFTIAVDDTIHLIAQFRREQKPGRSNRLIIESTLNEVGLPILITSIILVFGFSVLIFSSLWDIQMFGIIISAMIIFALTIDLFIVPSILKSMNVKFANGPK